MSLTISTESSREIACEVHRSEFFPAVVTCLKTRRRYTYSVIFPNIMISFKGSNFRRKEVFCWWEFRKQESSVLSTPFQFYSPIWNLPPPPSSISSHCPSQAVDLSKSERTHLFSGSEPLIEDN